MKLHTETQMVISPVALALVVVVDVGPHVASVDVRRVPTAAL